MKQVQAALVILMLSMATAELGSEEHKNDKKETLERNQRIKYFGIQYYNLSVLTLHPSVGISSDPIQKQEQELFEQGKHYNISETTIKFAVFQQHQNDIENGYYSQAGRHQATQVVRAIFNSSSEAFRTLVTQAGLAPQNNTEPIQPAD